MAVVAALALCAVVLWLPGTVLTWWLLPGSSRLVRLAVAPAVSYGLLYGLASYLDVVGARVQWRTVALPVVVAAAVGGFLLLRARGWTRPRLAVPHLALGAAVVVAYGLWWWAIRSTTTVPTYDDGANAGIFTYRIGLLGTIAPDRIIATDLGDGAGGVAFYPLALHLVASFLVQLTGLEPGAALHVQTATLVAVALPVGTFALTRAVTRAARPAGVLPGAAAGASALVVAALPAMPWGHLPWGALAMVSGIALMPAGLLLTLALPRHGARAGVLLGAAVAGVFAVHSSEVVTCAVLGAAALGAVCARQRRRWRAALRGAGAAAATGLLALGPVLALLGGGLSERAAGTPGPAEAPLDALHDGWLGLLSAPTLADEWGGRQVLLAWVLSALLVLGLAVARADRVVVAMTVASGLLALLAWACITGSTVAHRLAIPWYSNGFRLLATLTVPVGMLVGIGIARLLGRAPLRVGAVTVGLGVLLLAPAVAICATIGSRTYDAYSVVTASDRDAYAWLAAHTRPGERVLNDSHDGSMWMYPLDGVAPVFGPKSDLWYRAGWQDRWYLLQHAAQLGVDPQVRRIADDLDVRYLLVGERVVYGEDRQLDLPLLLASGAWREAYRSGDAVVLVRSD